MKLMEVKLVEPRLSFDFQHLGFVRKLFLFDYLPYQKILFGVFICFLFKSLFFMNLKENYKIILLLFLLPKRLNLTLIYKNGRINKHTIKLKDLSLR